MRERRQILLTSLRLNERYGLPGDRDNSLLLWSKTSAR